MEYKIVMDVSGDLDAAFAKEHDVLFVPMEYSLGDRMLTCSGPESRETLKPFYDSQRHGDLTKTSQISPYMYEEFMTPIFREGYSVLYLCLSSGLSSTYQSSNMAKASLEEEYPGRKLVPVDTLAATGGMGVLAERAVRNRDAGMSLEENYADLTEAASHVKHWFFVQDLMYLMRGGRVNAASAVVGTVLNVKPVLKVNEEGKLDTIDKKRGNKAAARAILELFRESYDPDSHDVIYICDADAQEQGDQLEAEVRKMVPDARIRRCPLSPIIGAHVGPGMSAICHMGK